MSEKDLLWEELGLNNLLAQNNKSYEKTIDNAIEQRLVRDKKVAIIKHREMLKKPNYAVLMDRYQSLPHKPKTITKDKIASLADPVLGKLSRLDRIKYEQSQQQNELDSDYELQSSFYPADHTNNPQYNEMMKLLQEPLSKVTLSPQRQSEGSSHYQHHGHSGYSNYNSPQKSISSLLSTSQRQEIRKSTNTNGAEGGGGLFLTETNDSGVEYSDLETPNISHQAGRSYSEGIFLTAAGGLEHESSSAVHPFASLLKSKIDEAAQFLHDNNNNKTSSLLLDPMAWMKNHQENQIFGNQNIRNNIRTKQSLPVTKKNKKKTPSTAASLALNKLNKPQFNVDNNLETRARNRNQHLRKNRLIATTETNKQPRGSSTSRNKKDVHLYHDPVTKKTKKVISSGYGTDTSNNNGSNGKSNALKANVAKMKQQIKAMKQSNYTSGGGIGGGNKKSTNSNNNANGNSNEENKELNGLKQMSSSRRKLLDSLMTASDYPLSSEDENNNNMNLKKSNVNSNAIQTTKSNVNTRKVNSNSNNSNVNNNVVLPDINNNTSSYSSSSRQRQRSAPPLANPRVNPDHLPSITETQYQQQHQHQLPPIVSVTSSSAPGRFRSSSKAALLRQSASTANTSSSSSAVAASNNNTNNSSNSSNNKNNGKSRVKSNKNSQLSSLGFDSNNNDVSESLGGALFASPSKIPIMATIFEQTGSSIGSDTNSQTKNSFTNDNTRNEDKELMDEEEALELLASYAATVKKPTAVITTSKATSRNATSSSNATTNKKNKINAIIGGDQSMDNEKEEGKEPNLDLHSAINKLKQYESSSSMMKKENQHKLSSLNTNSTNSGGGVNFTKPDTNANLVKHAERIGTNVSQIENALKSYRALKDDFA